MKYITHLVIIFIFVTLFPCFGQFPQSWGLLIGLSSSNLEYSYSRTDNTTSLDHKNGIKVGIFEEFFHHQYFNLLADLSYVQRGARDKDITVVGVSDNDNGFEEMGYLNLRYDYFSLAVLAKGKYNSGFFTPYISFGPSISYLAGGNDQAESRMSDYNKFVLGLTGGIGSEINVNLPLEFLVELRYYRDLTNIYENDQVTIKNHSFEFLFGLKF